jgi:hypothetical protein
MRCARGGVAVSCLVALAAGCGSTHNESSRSNPRKHVIILHGGEQKDLARASTATTLIRCISRGVAITAAPPAPSPEAKTTNGRDLAKRGRNGNATLSISTAPDGHVHAACF